MRRTRFAVVAGTVLLAVSAVGHAQNAYTSRVANLRAGPDRSYPLVATIDPGAGVNINGCLSDWSWCDVSFDDTRGWVYAKSLAYAYQGSQVPFYSYAPTFGLPIITFSLGTYWDRYYRGRPWYAQRSQWISRPVPHRRPPGPPPSASLPPHFAPGRPSRPPVGPRPGSGPRPPNGVRPPGGPGPGAGPRPPGGERPPAGPRPSSGSQREVPERGAPPARGEQSRGGQQGDRSKRPPEGDRGDNRPQ